MNIISNLTGGQIFSIVILGFMLLVLLESFRRQTIDEPWPKVAIRWIFVIIGGRITIHGLSELYQGKWMGIMWISLGTGIVYMASREYLRKKRAEKEKWRE